MITKDQIGQKFVDKKTGATVTLLALDNWSVRSSSSGRWRLRLMACVSNPAIPNTSGIPGLNNYWVNQNELLPEAN